MNKFFENNDSISAIDAQYAAQKIAFAPIIFQVAKSMRDLGLLDALYENDKNGLTVEELSKIVKLTTYGVKTLIETSLSSDIVKIKDDKYFITKTGYFLLKDEMTKINMNFNHYVNYQGLYYLDDAIKNTKASGLKVFGEGETIYPKISTLPAKAKQSWFEFDHFYSDTAFKEAIEVLLKTNPKKILDIGGNTGKFSSLVAKTSKDVKLTIADLPQQVELAKVNVKSQDLENQIDYFPTNILDHTQELPSGYDIIWMSQFLDCFGEDDIVQLLKRIKSKMSDTSRIYIMEPLWDYQRFEASAYCIINTSPYFTALANGNSKMFNATDMIDYINKAGLEVEECINDIGLCQSILICK